MGVGRRQEKGLNLYEPAIGSIQKLFPFEKEVCILWVFYCMVSEELATGVDEESYMTATAPLRVNIG